MYDHEKLTKMLKNSYYETYGKWPSQTTEKVIDCIDDAFMEQWRKDILEEDKKLQNELSSVEREAQTTIDALKAETEACKENEIQDQKISDALKAYKTIVSMKFDTPQQQLQNIQNASYFIWALYSDGGNSNMFSGLSKDKVSDVKSESSTRTYGIRI